MHNRFPLWLILPCLLVDALAAQQPAPRAVKTYPLHELVGALAPPRRPPNLSFLYPEGDAQIGLQPLWDERNLVDGDGVIELLRWIYGGDIDSERLALDLQGEVLVASGDPGTVLDVGHRIDQLTAVLARPIEITAALYGDEDVASLPAILDPAAVRALAQRAPIWSRTIVARSGIVVDAAGEKWTTYVRDYDVEVAERAHIGDPRVGELFEGVRLLIEPHALLGGDGLAVFLTYAFGEQRGEMGSRSTGVQGQGDLDVPVVNLNTGSASARLENGGGIVIAAGGAGEAGSRAQLVITLRHPAPTEQAPLGLRMLPVSALISPRQRTQPDLPRRYPGWSGSGFGFDEDEGDSLYGAVDEDMLVEILRRTLSGIVPEDELGEMVVYGGHLCISATDETAKVETELQRLEQAWLRNTEVEVVTRVHPAGPAGNAVTVLHRIAFPALLGRWLAANRGIETVVIRDADVEIAQRSAVANPVVRPWFTGLSVQLRPFACNRGIGAELLVDVTTDGGRQERTAEDVFGGSWDSVVTGRARFRHQGAWPSEAMVLGTGPLMGTDGKSWRATQVVRITQR